LLSPTYVKGQFVLNKQKAPTLTSSAISILAPSTTHILAPISQKQITNNIPTVPKSRPPLRQNFILEVPEASVPAVEMCWLISEAGMRTSASETE
jgi:hypothetical protein